MTYSEMRQWFQSLDRVNIAGNTPVVVAFHATGTPEGVMLLPVVTVDEIANTPVITVKPPEHITVHLSTTN